MPLSIQIDERCYSGFHVFQFKTGKYEVAREKFESVLGSKPTPEESSVASYNVACFTLSLNQVKAGPLSALEDALLAVYEDLRESGQILT
ncbi:hypothetical protein CUMW_180380 [Citrus unshiu]|nr:hypothetical protein CUMW_180380 [Citrus unshiu]